MTTAAEARQAETGSTEPEVVIGSFSVIKQEWRRRHLLLALRGLERANSTIELATSRPEVRAILEQEQAGTYAEPISPHVRDARDDFIKANSPVGETRSARQDWLDFAATYGGCANSEARDLYRKSLALLLQ